MHIATGQNGYLLSNILRCSVPLEGYCYHFGCPIDSHTERNRELLDKHLKDTEDIIKKCRKFNLKLVYASSMAVCCPCSDTQYRTAKMLVESMLDPKLDLIWRIPRVYSYDRPRGLVYELKQGLMPRPENVIQWVYLGDFLQDFVKSLDDVGIRAYKGVYHTSKVKNILDELRELKMRFGV